MKSKNYKYILIFISITILATIGLQIYWNLKNYAENERRLINDVQIAFDNSIEHYYAEDLKESYISFIGNDSEKDPNFIDKVLADSTFTNQLTRSKKGKSSIKTKATKSSLEEDNAIKITTSIKINDPSKKFNKEKLVRELADTLQNSEVKNITFSDTQKQLTTISDSKFSPNSIAKVRVIKGKPAFDSISKIKNFTNKILLSIRNDSIELNKINNELTKELARKDIQIAHGIEHLKADTVFQHHNTKPNLTLHTFGNSTFLPQNQKLKLLFSNPTILILKRSMVEIILSLLLSLSIIFCLLHLLKTINRQKKIDDMKNDLISNITHEFKTPITTVSTALEGIKNFNAINDKDKTTRYIDISNQQLKKLEIMVEKLLETASLETDKIILNKESTDLVELLRSNIEKHQMNSIGQNFNFNSDFEELSIKADVFHLENAISNILDNAVKYGGNWVEIFLKTKNDKVLISIEDNGKGIEKREREKIFDKFYRIQKGNIHDVKGFGIGLYYSKKIIEKHDGTIELAVNSKTIFKITLPNE
jgi:signal transduction histidine kinase